MLKKMELSSNLKDICSVSYELFDPEPIANQMKAGDPIQFTSIESGALSTEEIQQQVSKCDGISLAAAGLDVAITKIECISFEGSLVLPAQFAMQYQFRVANYSDVKITEVPVTLYFNPVGSSLVQQGVTTVRNIPARTYQKLSFTFPPVEAGNWVMTMEANKNRGFTETNYTNNTLSQTFRYENRYELKAESIREVNNRTTLPLNTDITFEFVILNAGPQTATSIPIDFPAYFTPQNGKPVFGSMGGFTIQSLPAQQRSRGTFIVSFPKSSTAMIGLRIDKDNLKNDLLRSNNEIYETFQIGQKVNPPSGDDKIDIDFSKSVDSGKKIMPLYDQSLADTWVGLDESLPVKTFQASGCGLCSIAMVLAYLNDTQGDPTPKTPITPADLYKRGVTGSTYTSIQNWSSCSDVYDFDRYALGDEEEFRTVLITKVYDQIVNQNTPVIYYYTGNPTHFVVISGYEFDMEKTLSSSPSYDPNYDPNPYGLMHFRIMNPYKNETTNLRDLQNDKKFGKSSTFRFVRTK